MSLGAGLAVLLILVPVLGGLVSLLSRRREHIRWAAIITSVIISACSLALLIYLAVNDLTVLEVSPEEVFPMGEAIFLFGYVLSAGFIYLGWRMRSPLVAALAIAEVVLSTVVLVWAGYASASPVILIDYLSVILVLITSLIGSVIVIYSLRYMKNDPRQPRFFAATLLFLGSMNGAVMANDMMWLLLFWELTTLCSFLLIGHTGTEEAKAAAKRALVITLAGGVVFVLGAAAAFHYFGDLSIMDIPISGLEGLALLPLALMAVACFTKSAQVPFQSWLLGAMVAPTPVSALLHSATMVNLGVYFLIRLSPNFAGAGALTWAIALVGALSFLTSSILAITQDNAKRVLAWSTIGNLGLITMCVGVSTSLAITAGVILLLYHAISKALMFLSVGVVKEEKHSEGIEEMEGLRATMPFVSLAMFIGIITIVLPPFGMFASKWLISEASVTFPFLVFLLGAGFAGTVVYYFKWMGTVLSAGPSEPVRLRSDPTPKVYKWTLGALIGGAIVLSVLIGPVLKYLVEPFINRYFVQPIGTDNLSLFTSTGEFPVFLFLLLVALVFIGLVFLVRPGKEEVTTPYASGETFAFQSSNNYYLDERMVGQAISIAEGAGVVLVVALVATPLLLGVV